MKKIISLGIASAICALTAVSASAADAGVRLTAEGEVATGKTITISVSTLAELEVLQFDIDAKGLKIESITMNPAAGTGMANSTNTRVMVASTSKIPAGTLICTMTATVTAQAGEKATIALGDKDGVSTSILPEGNALEVEVKGAAVTPPTSSGTTSDPTSSGTTSTSTPTSSGTSQGGSTTNPNTGVALAVIPAVLAAAGVVVAKKRK